jgi:hypothetical protein
VLSYQAVKQQIDALVASFKRKAEGGLTFWEVLTFLKEVVAALMQVAAEWNGDGASKKKLVVDAITEIIDVILASLTFPGIPFYVVWLLKAALPLAKTYLLNQVDLWLEQNYLAKFKAA